MPVKKMPGAFAISAKKSSSPFSRACGLFEHHMAESLVSMPFLISPADLLHRLEEGYGEVGEMRRKLLVASYAEPPKRYRRVLVQRRWDIRAEHNDREFGEKAVDVRRHAVALPHCNFTARPGSVINHSKCGFGVVLRLCGVELSDGQLHERREIRLELWEDVDAAVAEESVRGLLDVVVGISHAVGEELEHVRLGGHCQFSALWLL